MQDNSPLDTAYNRLDEVHRAWHMALSGYHRIDDFRANINTTIQSLRNLTFALQKQKDQFRDFDSWYGEWQTKMRNDPILKELHEARNIIVKQEDLILKSTATARVKGWEELMKMSFEFNPVSDSYDIAKGFYETYAKTLPVDKNFKNRLVFEFERRWVYEKIPECELLEALAYAYNFFHEMLDDASQKLSLPKKKNFMTGEYCSGEFNNEGRLKCMAITSQERCLAFGFEHGNLLQMQTRQISRNEDDLRKVHEKYGDFWKSEEIISLLDGVFPTEYPFDQMKLFVQVAISNLKRDKYLIPTSFLFKENDNVPIIVVHPFDNQEQKLLLLDKVASDVIKNNVKFILIVSEVWLYNLDKKRHKTPTHGDTRDTKEILQAACLSADKIKIISIPFKKSIFGSIIFSKPEVEDFLSNEEHHQYILTPLIESLKKVSKKEK